MRGTLTFLNNLDNHRPTAEPEWCLFFIDLTLTIINNMCSRINRNNSDLNLNNPFSGFLVLSYFILFIFCSVVSLDAGLYFGLSINDPEAWKVVFISVFVINSGTVFPIMIIASNKQLCKWIRKKLPRCFICYGKLNSVATV